MRLAIMQSKVFMYWSLHKDDPASHQLRPLVDWAFVNPLADPEFDEIFKAEKHLSKGHRSAVSDDRVIVAIPYLMFLHLDSVSLADGSAPTNSTTRSIADAFNKISRFLVNLRYISKQFEFPTGENDFFVISEVEISRLPTVKFPLILPDTNTRIRKDIVDTAITWRDVEAATTHPIDFTPPTFDTILLDAIRALTDGDYRRAILYAAMSVEIIAATTLDEVYTSTIKQGNASGNIRIAAIPQTDGRTIFKDPVYEYLSNKTDFAQLLHERPLYLLNRSLLIENTQLYQTALKLYRTK